MNVALNNQLVEAVKILREAEKKYVPQINKYKKDIEEANKKIKNYQQSAWFIKKPTEPKKIEEKQKMNMILLLLFVWPVGIPYAIYFSSTKKNREKKNNEEYVKEMEVFNAQINELKEQIAKENKTILERKKAINDINIQKQRFLQIYNNSLAFLPKPYRNLTAATRLYEIIHEEYAFNLSDAIKLYEHQIQALIDLQNHLEEKREREEREAREEKRYKETQKALNNIEYYQKLSVEEQSRTNENLDKIHQEQIRNRDY